MSASDLGLRRAAAEEGPRPPVRVMGALFEQFVALELIRSMRQSGSSCQLQFWRDPDGAEVDWVIQGENRWLPIEVKWGDVPTDRDAKHLRTFLTEHPLAKEAVIVCRTPRAFKLSPTIRTAIEPERKTPARGEAPCRG